METVAMTRRMFFTSGSLARPPCRAPRPSGRLAARRLSRTASRLLETSLLLVSRLREECLDVVSLEIVNGLPGGLYSLGYYHVVYC